MPLTSRRAGRTALGLLVNMLVLGVSGCASRVDDDGLEKYPVQGQVRVNGQPAEGLSVRFQKRDGVPPGNPSHPTGVTDAQGKFVLSTSSEADGAIVGEYDVSFLWPSGHGPSAYDRLGDKYSNPAKTEFHVTIKPEPNEVGVFDLKADLDAVKKSRASKEIPQ